MARMKSFLFRQCRDGVSSSIPVREVRVNTYYSEEIFNISIAVFDENHLQLGDIVYYKDITGMSKDEANNNANYSVASRVVSIDPKTEWKKLL
jgi:hypothetical protein